MAQKECSRQRTQERQLPFPGWSDGRITYTTLPHSSTTSLSCSDCHLHLDLAVRLVSGECKISKGAALDTRDGIGDIKCGEGPRLALQLLFESVDVVEIHVSIADGVDEVAALEAGEVREDAGKQGVRRDVERHPQAQVGRSLVHLAGKLAVGHVELRKHVARGEGHLVQVGRVPRRHDDAPIVRLVFDLVKHVGNLVDALPSVVGVHILVLGAEVAPLPAVHRTQVTLLTVRQTDGIEVLSRRVAVPDVNLLLLQFRRGRLSVKEPEKLLRYASPEDRFRREQRETLAQREAHLSSELGESTRSRPVAAHYAVLYHVTHQVEVLLLLVHTARHVRRPVRRVPHGRAIARGAACVAGRGERGCGRRRVACAGRWAVLHEAVAQLAFHLGVGGLLPHKSISKWREESVTVEGGRVVRLGLDLCDKDALARAAHPQRALVHRRAANNENCLNGVGLGKESQRTLQAVGDEHTIWDGEIQLRVLVSCDHDIQAIVERPEFVWNGLPCLTTHHNGIALQRVARGAGELLEVRHVGAEAPRQLTVHPNASAMLTHAHHNAEAPPFA
mmetsp:Transcript_42750/g.106420  ORF Transcript_42750/g.106420 Transcript_42750/m.106420 type:complete len:561 (+) Transcript_42750:336-2018(+)